MQNINRKGTYNPIRHGGKSLANGKPDNAVAEERGENADEKNGPRRELVAGDSGKNPDVFSDIVGDAENRELLLAEAED